LALKSFCRSLLLLQLGADYAERRRCGMIMFENRCCRPYVRFNRGVSPA